MRSIVTVTLNPAIDGSAEAKQVIPVRKVRTTNERYDPGGGGINVARVIHRFGGDVLAIYLAGGATGGVLDGLLDAEGVERLRIGIAGHTRISMAVFDQTSHQEFRFVPQGPEVSADELGEVVKCISRLRCDYLVLSGSLPRGLDAKAYASIAKSAGSARIVLDTSGPALMATLDAGGIYLAKPSRGEFEQLVGYPVSDLASEMRAFVNSGKVDNLVVTLGHEGAMLATPKHIYRLDPIKTDAKSAVGAGDSFVGGMVFSLARGDSIEMAFRMGMAAGTASVMNPGTGLCKKEDVERLLNSVPAPYDAVM